MELLQTCDYYILNKDQHSLWFCRKTGQHEFKTYGPTRLALVTRVREVGAPICGGGGVGCRVYGIKRVAFLPLSQQPLDAAAVTALGLSPCRKHHSSNNINGERKMPVLPDARTGLSKTFGTLKSVTSTLRTATVNAAATATGQSKIRRDDRERYERRILEELLKMFNESESGESFYYATGVADLTSSLQRQHSPDYDASQPLWLRANDRFFWNRHMLADFMANAAEVANVWVVPVIQGFVQIEAVPLTNTDSAQPGDFYSLCLVSRRSRHRAGTRYRRRGVDEDGHVANFVESEQIIALNSHVIAFVQVRGSVPIYWSQPGYKYRPPPRLDRGPEETLLAFMRHFEEEVRQYGHILCVNLVEQVGKEKVIADAYTDNILKYNSSDLTYITFDFHEYCRGLRYENVCVLVEGLEDMLKAGGYCWVDKQGVICQQRSVVRTNCIDCLDRTNVVQTAFARAMLERQFVKLGLLSPEQQLPALCRVALNTMWANNGDNLSRQYAGTQALKGDFTRTGERKFSSLMKDGMNSANRFLQQALSDDLRHIAVAVLLGKHLDTDQDFDTEGVLSGIGTTYRYYLNRFKDAYRQATIDHMLGNTQPSDLLQQLDAVDGIVGAAEEEDDANAVAQHVKSVIDDTTTLLVPDAHTILGAWGLIDADPQTGDPDQTDMDTILVLTRDSYYVAEYDEGSDRITNYQRVSLIDLDSIEVGPYTFPSMFKPSRTYYCLRLKYQLDQQSGYCHTLRSMNIRFFNNMAITIRTEEERVESIKAIGDTFAVGVEMVGCEAPLHLLPRLEKMKSRGRTSNLLNPLHVFGSPLASLTRPGPDTFKSASSRAFSNMTSGLARLNPISNLRKSSERNSGSISGTPVFYVQKPAVAVDLLLSDDQEPTNYLYPEIHLNTCGVLASSVSTEAHQGPSGRPSIPSPVSPNSRSQSDGCLRSPGLTSPNLSPLPTNRSVTPEIFVSEENTKLCLDGTQDTSFHPLKLSPMFSQRVRKLSHSSDEVDVREPPLSCVAPTDNAVFEDTAIIRASSATDLQLHLSSSRSDSGLLSSVSAFSNPVSPLAAFQRDGVFGAPFTALAKGMKSLAPGAGKLTQGMQGIGTNFDPRKLKEQRQLRADQDLIWKAKKEKCKTVIIQF